MSIPSDFWVSPAELSLRFSYPVRKRKLSFHNQKRDVKTWQLHCRAKLAKMIGFQAPSPVLLRMLRQKQMENVSIQALVMEVNANLHIPAYWLIPSDRAPKGTVMALHGHGEVECCLGAWEDYHHQFALELAFQGYRVLCPELRGFGALKDLALHLEGHRLDYWRWGEHMAYSLVTDGFQKGHTLIGDTVEDLLRWEGWLMEACGFQPIDVVGISYGGDLALIYSALSAHVRSVFASGTFGSFAPIFERCYNAPAHCIPNILEWMDRADIAGLSAPRPLVLHYGALDVPGPENYSASYNESVLPAFEELEAIYATMGAASNVSLVISDGKRHEMDISAVLNHLSML